MVTTILCVDASTPVFGRVAISTGVLGMICPGAPVPDLAPVVAAVLAKPRKQLAPGVHLVEVRGSSGRLAQVFILERAVFAGGAGTAIVGWLEFALGSREDIEIDVRSRSTWTPATLEA